MCVCDICIVHLSNLVEPQLFRRNFTEVDQKSEEYGKDSYTSSQNTQQFHENSGWPLENTPECRSFSVMTYNVLAESYTLVPRYHYCPEFARR